MLWVGYRNQLKSLFLVLPNYLASREWFWIPWGLFEILTPFLGTFSFGHFETLLLKICTPVISCPGQLNR